MTNVFESTAAIVALTPSSEEACLPQRKNIASAPLAGSYEDLAPEVVTHFSEVDNDIWISSVVESIQSPRPVPSFTPLVRKLTGFKKKKTKNIPSSPLTTIHEESEILFDTFAQKFDPHFASRLNYVHSIETMDVTPPLKVIEFFDWLSNIYLGGTFMNHVLAILSESKFVDAIGIDKKPVFTKIFSWMASRRTTRRSPPSFLAASNAIVLGSLFRHDVGNPMSASPSSEFNMEIDSEKHAAFVVNYALARCALGNVCLMRSSETTPPSLIDYLSLMRPTPCSFRKASVADCEIPTYISIGGAYTGVWLELMRGLTRIYGSGRALPHVLSDWNHVKASRIFEIIRTPLFVGPSFPQINEVTFQGMFDNIPGVATAKKISQKLDTLLDEDTITRIVKNAVANPVNESISPLIDMANAGAAELSPLSGAAAKVSSLIDGISVALSTLYKLTPVLIPLAVGYVVYLMLDNDEVDYRILFTALASAAAMYGFSNIIAAAVSEVAHLGTDTEQGYGAIFGSTLRLVATYLCSVGFDVSFGSLKGLFLKYSSVSRSVDAIFKDLLSIFMSIYPSLSPYMPKCVLGAFVNSDSVMEFIAEANEITRQVAAKTLVSTPEAYDKVERMKSIAMVALRDVPKDNHADSTLIKSYLDQLMKISTKMAGELGGNIVSTRPVCVLMLGLPGTGKSLTAMRLAESWVSHALKDDKYLSDAYEARKDVYIHSRSTDKWWDGITPSTKVVIWDDLGQAAEVRGQDNNPWLDIVKVGNEMAFLPAMAFDKHNVILRPDIVIATTNRHDFKSETITAPAAVSRRFDIILRVVTTEKPQGRPLLEGFDPDKCMFEVQKVASDGVGILATKYTLTYAEVILLMHHVHSVNARFSAKTVEEGPTIERMVQSDLLKTPIDELEKLMQDIGKATHRPKIACVKVADVLREMYAARADTSHIPMVDIPPEEDIDPPMFFQGEAQNLPLTQEYKYQLVLESMFPRRNKLGFETFQQWKRRHLLVYADVYEYEEHEKFLHLFALSYNRGKHPIEVPRSIEDFKEALEWVINEGPMPLLTPSERGVYINLGYQPSPCTLPPGGYNLESGETVFIGDDGHPVILPDAPTFTPTELNFGIALMDVFLDPSKAKAYGEQLVKQIKDFGKRVAGWDVAQFKLLIVKSFCKPRNQELAEAGFGHVRVPKEYEYPSFGEFLTSSMWKACTSVFKFLTETPLISALLAATVATLTAEFFVNLIVGKRGYVKKKKSFEQSASPSRMVSRNFGRVKADNHKNWQKIKALSMVRPEEQSASNIDDVIGKVRKNLYDFWSMDSTGNMVKHGLALGVGTNKFLCNIHYFARANVAHEQAVRNKVIEPEDYTFMLTQGAKQEFAFKFTPQNFEFDNNAEPDRDACLFIVHKFPRQNKDLTAQFISEDESLTLFTTRFTDGATSGVLLGHESARYFTRCTPTVSLTVNFSTEPRVIKEVIGYGIATAKGECGSPVILTSGKWAGKLFGIHVAGNNLNKGFANRVSGEWVFGKEANFHHIYEVETNDLIVAGLQEEATVEQGLDFTKFVHPGTNILTHNHLKPSNTFATSKIVEYDGPGEPYFTRLTAPADLSPARYFQARLNYVEPIIAPLNMKVLNAICIHLTERFKRHGMGAEIRRLTFDETIRGVPGSLLGSVDTTTSPGYPDTVFGTKTKDYFSFEGSKLIYGKKFAEFKLDLESKIDILINGGVPLFVFQDVLKDERRGLQKVADGKTRMICPSPEDLKILWKMFFGGAEWCMKEGKIFNGVLLGVNPHGESWKLVHALLTSLNDGNYCFSGDFAGYDGNQHRLLLSLAGKVMMDMYPEDGYRRLREGLVQACTHSHHIFGPILERWDHNLPSGFPGTTSFNCIANLIMHMYHFCSLHDFDINCLPAFESEVKLLVLGDDNIGSVSERLKDVYTEASFAKTARLFGHTYTAADKSPPHEKNSHWSNHTILKCGFNYVPDIGRHVGNLDLNVILERPMWTKDGLDAISIARSNMDDSLLDLSMHGREIFETWAPRMKQFAGPDASSVYFNFDVALAKAAAGSDGMI
jgi:hypothetical protein